MTDDTTTAADDKIRDYLDNHRPTARPVKENNDPPARLHELDFLLGKMVTTFDTGVLMEAVTRPIMGGHYYQMDLKATYADGSPKLEGKWIIGWSEPDQHFESYYVDSMGTLGVSTSPGWVDGHLEFIGDHVLGEVGVRSRSKDAYTPVDERHFRLDAFVEVDGAWKLYDIQDCTITPPSEL
ncbi:hypothetical protein AV521_45100 [Streptomyces sp. IMTB 2501]|uniref:DUF1579 family protein n=1 Tax=Streptomyces sp. IMTB 2501 TaxID=1776340 RepID=UPI00096FA552|nr:DUF1579 family protein [Streptomyces sp. IMTB 2501]OLZ60599.1 hypothetical protein AV521_45100 [Streptomyces sp. IMTB 2501]